MKSHSNKTWLVPVIEPGKYVERAVVLRCDVVDAEGNIVGTEQPGTFDYVSNARMVDAYNERAAFELWKERRKLGPAEPGIYREIWEAINRR